MARILLFSALLLLPTVLAAPTSPGPWSGRVAEGEANAHWFQNVPSGFACPEFPWGDDRRYVVTLTYAPPTDTLVLRWGPWEVVGRAGVAVLDYDGYSCQAGWFHVEGRDVAAVAAYAVQATQGGPPRGWIACDELC